MMVLVLFLVIDAKNVTHFVEKQVAFQTGGILSIGKTDFNAFRGFTFRDIKFSPPSADGLPNPDEQKIISIQKE